MVCGCAVSSASAEQDSAVEAGADWYLSLGLGANYGARAELENLDVKVDYDLGLPRLKGGVGWRLGERWWLDASISQRKTKAEFSYPTVGEGGSDVAANDRYSSVSIMFSALREFRVGPWLRPYLGAGAGPTWLTYQHSVAGSGSAEDLVVIRDDTEAMAYQGMVGVRFPLTRRFDLGLEYEYWRTPNVELESLQGAEVTLDQAVHSGWVSLLWYPGADRDMAFGRPRANGLAPRGFYLTGTAGVNWLADRETGPVTFDASAPGALISAAVGHDLGRRWRLELEYAYRRNSPEVLDFGSVIGESRVSGKLSSSSLGANLHLDPWPQAAVQPTLGLGLGWSRLDYDVDFAEGEAFTSSSADVAHFQVIAGFNVEISRSLSFRTAWRFWITSEHDVDLSDGASVETDRVANTVEFGLIYRLAD
jgi:opacity protein-like surface antigen